MSATQQPPQQPNFAKLVYQNTLWWQLELTPQALAKLVEGKDFTHDDIAAVTFSPAWQEWFLSIPVAFDEMMTLANYKAFFKQLAQVCAHYQSTRNQSYSASSESSSATQRQFTLELATQQGQQRFIHQLHFYQQGQTHFVWAQCINSSEITSPLSDPQTADEGLLGEDVLLKGANSQMVKHLYERQQLLEEQNRLVKRSFENQSRFLAVLSHELRSPLLGVNATLERLLEQYGEDKALAERFLSLSTTVDYLVYLINDILTYSQTEYETMQLQPHEFDLNLLLEDVASLTTDIARQKNLALKTTFKGQNSEVFGDSVRLKQVLINLVVNSIKFTEQGWVRVDVEAIGGGKYRFVVADTGVGMDQSSLNAIFEPFAQLDMSQLGYQFGAGLGLFIVKKLLQLMHSEIRVESTPNQGTCFYFTISLDNHEQKRLDPQANTDSYLHSATHTAIVPTKPSRSAALDSRFELNESPVTPLSSGAVSASLSATKPYAASLQKTKQKAKGQGVQSVASDSVKGRVPPANRFFDLDDEILLHANTEHKMPHKAPHTALTEDSEKSLQEVPSSTGPKLSVLVAEDSDLNRMVVVELLKELNCDVVATVNGAEAWQVLQEQEFDLVLLDIQMPKMSGIEVAKRLKALEEETGRGHLHQVVAITAGGNADLFATGESLSENGFDDWVLKPINREKLAQWIPTNQAKSYPDKKKHNAFTEKSTPKEQSAAFRSDTIKQKNVHNTIASLGGRDELSELFSDLRLDDYAQIPDMFRGMFAEFSQESHSLIERLSAELASEDWDGFAKSAHKLKGSMMLMNLTNASNWLKQAEILSGSSEKSELKQLLLVKVIQQLQTLLKNLEKSHAIRHN